MKFKLLSAVLLISIILTLSGCNSQDEHVNEPLDEAAAIDTSEIPCTKWVCREVDMYFHTLDFGAPDIIGEYNDGSETFRLIGKIDFYGGMNFTLYSEAGEISSNIPVAQGFVFTSCSYENDTMVCTVNSVDGLDFEATTLSFDKNEASKTVKDNWRCNETDMSMSTFNEIDGYFSGEITIDGENCNFLAFEITNGIYRFHVENGKFNGLTEGTSPLIDMIITEKDGKLIGKLSATSIEDKDAFPYWDFGKTEISFTKQ